MIISVGAHALMFVVSVLFSVMLSGDTDTTFVIGLLFCVILCSLIRLAPLRCWIALAMMFCMVCLFVSQWIALMPIVGFDLGLRVQSLGRSFQMLVCVPPLVCGIVAGQHSPALHDLSAAATSPLVMALWILCALTSLAVLGGWVFALVQRRQRCFQSLADDQRERIRRSRARLADVESARSADLQHARLTERTRIAREIHDNVGHLLTRAIMLTNADQVIATSTGDTLHADQFGQLGHTLDEAMTMIRKSVHDLKDEGTDFRAMIEDAMATAKQSDVEIRLSNAIDAVPSHVAHAFTAVIREALTNTIRHSAASEAHVHLIDLPGLWQLIVQDNGGVPERGRVASMGIGIADIEERARALDGTATCGYHNGGWRVFMSVPKTAERNMR